MTGKILIVDDIPSNVELLSRLLKKQGYALVGATSGKSALELIHRDQPDVILLDIQMPIMNGYEVCQQLKADERTRDIPIIFISATGDSESIVKAFEMGGADYVAKPFNAREVVARVTSQLVVVKQRREIEALREQDRQHFDAINEMKSLFIGNATHDLKNPLFIINGYVSLMQEEEDIANHPLGSQAIVGIRQGVEKMSALVTNMLDLVQIETSANLYFTSVSVPDFLQNCVHGFDVLAKQKGIDFTLLHAPDVAVPMDIQWMKRVMDNLISNAIKYTPEGGAVEVSARLESDFVVLCVADSGYGIPEDAIPSLFTPFYRVKSEQHMGEAGTGLGLSIVKAIVEQHAGSIYVESEPGKGSTFSVCLPF